MRDQLFSCSGFPIQPGFSGTSLVESCESGVCVVQLSARPDEPGGDALQALFQRIQRALKERYGEPESSTYEVPRRCMGDELLSCLKSEEALLYAEWSWGPEQDVSLRAVADSGGLVRLQYTKRPPNTMQGL